MEKEKRYEEYAYVLDFLPHGRPGVRITGRVGYRAGALVQLVGEEFFTLLEALVKEGVTLKPHDRVYVGKEAREEITYIIGRIGYDELTSAAKMELPAVISRIVLNSEIVNLCDFPLWYCPKTSENLCTIATKTEVLANDTDVFNYETGEICVTNPHPTEKITFSVRCEKIH